MRLGEYTKGTSRISSPWPVLNVKAPLSATKLSLVFPLASFLCCCSLAMEILKEEENHLNAILLVNFIFNICRWYCSLPEYPKFVPRYTEVCFHGKGMIRRDGNNWKIGCLDQFLSFTLGELLNLSSELWCAVTTTTKLPDNTQNFCPSLKSPLAGISRSNSAPSYLD